MPIRQDHKNQIKNYIESLEFNSGSGLFNLEVTEHYITNANRYPYIFITSGELKPNIKNNASQFELGINGTYYRCYEYRLVTVFKIGLNNGETENLIDSLEELIVNKLQSSEVRNSTAYTDFELISVSSPYSEDVSIQDNCVLKTFLVHVFEYVETP